MPQYVPNNGVNGKLKIQDTIDHLEDRRLPSNGTRTELTIRLRSAIVRENVLRNQHYHLSLEDMRKC